MTTSKFFSSEELKCHCNREDCNAFNLLPKFIEILDDIRDTYGIPLPVNSAARCEFWNKHIGGSPRSQHLIGKAVDIVVENKNIKKFILLCKSRGIKGVGIGNGWVHIDIRDSREVTWYY